MRRRGLNAPRVLIVGAAAGTGLACAEALAAHGADLILADCDGTQLTRVADRLGASSRFCDVIGHASVDIFAAEIGGIASSIDVLINAAGRGYVRPLAMTRVTRAMLPLLRRGHGQRLIINIASTSGFTTSDGIFPYTSSLEAFERLSAALKDQARGTGIEVVSIVPRLSPAPGTKSLWSDESYQLRQVDEIETADRVLELIGAARPEWRQRPPPMIRRA